MSDNNGRLTSLELEDSIYQASSLSVDSECSNLWLHYLQMLNGVCAAGARVAASLRSLNSRTGLDIHNSEFPGQAEWDAITHSLLAATISANSQAAPAIKSLEYFRHDLHSIDQKYRMNKVVVDNILSILNTQYRFCVATCDRLKTIADGAYNQHSGNDILEPDNIILSRYQSSSQPFNVCRNTNNSVMQKSIPELYNLIAESPRAPVGSSKNSICEPIEAYLYNCAQNSPAEFQLPSRDVNNTTQLDHTQYDSNASMFPETHRNTSAHIEGSRIFQATDTGNAGCLPNFEMIRGPSVNFLDTVRNSEGVRVNYLGTGKFTPKTTTPKSTRFGLHLPPISGLTSAAHTAQLRRWSEAAAHEMSERQDDAGNIRRWSVPWDGGQPPITENSANWYEDSKGSNMWDRTWNDERDPLETAIFLLSYRPQQHQNSTEKTNTGIDPILKRPFTTDGVMKGYSIWSGNNAIPFLRLPESKE